MFENSWLRRPKSRRQGLILVALILTAFAGVYLRSAMARIDLPDGPLAMIANTPNGARFLALNEMPPVGGQGEAVILLTSRAPVTTDGLTFSLMVKRVEINCAEATVRELKGSMYGPDGAYLTHVNYDGVLRALRETDVEFDLICAAAGRQTLAGLPRATGYEAAQQLMTGSE